MCAAFYHGLPSDVSTSDTTIAGVPCRVYHGGKPTIVYFHGGSFILGGLHSHDDVCGEICQRTGLTVVSVDYRLAPEHLHPAAFEDSLAVTLNIAAQGPFLLVGDSAGGNLAAAVAHAVRGHGITPLGLVLIYPGLGGDVDKGSYLTHAHAPMLTRADIVDSGGVIYGGTIPTNDPTALPLSDSDFSGIPPTLAIAAQCDPLADDCPRLRRRDHQGRRARHRDHRTRPRPWLPARPPHRPPRRRLLHPDLRRHK